MVATCTTPHVEGVVSRKVHRTAVGQCQVVEVRIANGRGYAVEYDRRGAAGERPVVGPVAAEGDYRIAAGTAGRVKVTRPRYLVCLDSQEIAKSYIVTVGHEGVFIVDGEGIGQHV